MSWKASLVAVVLAAAVCPTLSLAQNQGGGGGGGGNNGGGQGGRQRGGNFDPAQFQQMRLERIKQQLGAQDDEWKVIEPKLSKILDAQRQAMAGFGGGRGGFGGGGGRGNGGPGGGGGGGGGGEQAPTTKLGIAQAELRKATENEGASPEDIDKKLAAYRAARTEAQTALETARKDLKELLTPKQEAVLVLNSILE